MTANHIILNVVGGVVQEVFASDPAIQVTLVDWDVHDAADERAVDVQTADGYRRWAYVVGMTPDPLAELAGTDVERAIEAAEAA